MVIFPANLNIISLWGRLKILPWARVQLLDCWGNQGNYLMYFLAIFIVLKIFVKLLLHKYNHRSWKIVSNIEVSMLAVALTLYCFKEDSIVHQGIKFQNPICRILRIWQSATHILSFLYKIAFLKGKIIRFHFRDSWWPKTKFQIYWYGFIMGVH